MQIRGSNIKPGKVERELIILHSEGEMIWWPTCACHIQYSSLANKEQGCSVYHPPGYTKAATAITGRGGTFGCLSSIPLLD
jgi:hypothetical protein